RRAGVAKVGSRRAGKVGSVRGAACAVDGGAPAGGGRQRGVDIPQSGRTTRRRSAELARQAAKLIAVILAGAFRVRFHETKTIAARQIGQPVVAGGQGNRRDDIGRIPACHGGEAVGLGFECAGPAIGAGGVINAEDQLSAGGGDVEGQALDGCGLGELGPLGRQKIAVSVVAGRKHGSLTDGDRLRLRLRLRRAEKDQNGSQREERPSIIASIIAHENISTLSPHSWSESIGALSGVHPPYTK